MGAIKVLILLVLETFLVNCESGDDFEFESRYFKDDELDMALSMGLLQGLEPESNLIQRMFKRGQGRGYTEFSDEEAEAIVQRHNFHRSNTKPSASNMKHMVRNITF